MEDGCYQCLANLVTLHELQQENEKMNRKLSKLKRRIRSMKAELDQAEQLLDGQDALLTVVLNIE